MVRPRSIVPRSIVPRSIVEWSTVAVLVLVFAAPAHAAANDVPDDVLTLLERYEAAWERSDALALADLGAPNATAFLDLLDDERFDRTVEAAVTLSDITVTPHERLADARVVRFRKVHEEVFAGGTVTRGIADIEMVVRPAAGGLVILSHRIVPFPRPSGQDPYRPDAPGTWGDEHGAAEVAFQRGYRAVQQGDCVSALARFQSVLDAEERWVGGGGAGAPEYQTGTARFVAQVYHFAAVCELRAGERDRAIQLATRAVELNPRFPLALDFLAERAIEAGELQTATKYWQRSLDAWPDQPEVAAKLEFNEKALKFYPDPDVRALYVGVRGLPPAKAAVKLQRLLRRSAEEPETRRRLAIAYLQSMQPEKAKQVLTDNEYLHPHDVETQYLLARTYVALQRLEDAAAMLQRVWSRSPGYRDTEVLFAEVYGALRRYPDAIGVLQDALAKSPDDALLHFKLAIYSRRLGRTTEARSYLRRAAELRPPASVRRTIRDALHAW